MCTILTKSSVGTKPKILSKKYRRSTWNVPHSFDMSDCRLLQLQRLLVTFSEANEAEMQFLRGCNNAL